MKRKTAYLGLFAAVAIIFGYVESLIPVFAGIPGVKIGLANLAVLLYWTGIPGGKLPLYRLSAYL